MHRFPSPPSQFAMFGRRPVSFVLLIGLLLASSVGSALHSRQCCSSCVGAPQRPIQASCGLHKHGTNCGSQATARGDEQPAQDQTPVPTDDGGHHCAICMLLASPAVLCFQFSVCSVPEKIGERLDFRDVRLNVHFPPEVVRPRGPPVL